MLAWDVPRAGGTVRLRASKVRPLDYALLLVVSRVAAVLGLLGSCTCRDASRDRAWRTPLPIAGVYLVLFSLVSPLSRSGPTSSSAGTSSCTPHAVVCGGGGLWLLYRAMARQPLWQPLTVLRCWEDHTSAAKGAVRHGARRRRRKIRLYSGIQPRVGAPESPVTTSIQDIRGIVEF